MSTKKVIRNIEAAIDRICEDIKQKHGGSGADKLDSLSKPVNSYSRLIERDKQKRSIRQRMETLHIIKSLLLLRRT